MAAGATITRATDLALTDEQRDFVRAIRDFCEKELPEERLRELTDDYEDLHSQEMASRMAALGWYGLTIDEEYGGSGGSFSDAALFLEETARGRAPIGGYAVTLIVTGALNRFGTEEQKRDLLGRVAQGGALAIAMSEPESGSDVASLSTSARREDGEWVLSGSKMWCSYAHKASHILIVCRTEKGDSPHEGLSMIFVPRDAEGFRITPIDTLGGRETNELYLDDVRVPEDALLGQEGGGWTQLMAGLNYERLIIAAQSLGMAQRAFDDVLSYVKERRQFGRAIGSFQTIKHRLADLACELQATRELVYGVARAVEAQPDRMLPREASMAKLKSTELAKRTALEGMQMMGGYGYATEYDMEAHVRHTLVTTIYGGASEIQREIIARSLGL